MVSVLYVVISDLDICRYFSDTGTVIEAGIQAGGIKDTWYIIVLAVCLMSNILNIHVIYGGMIHDARVYECYRIV